MQATIAAVVERCGRIVLYSNAGIAPLGDRTARSPTWRTRPGSELRAGFAVGHTTGLQTAEEITDLVVFLASDLSRSMTGATVNCDRGWTAFKLPEILARAMGGG